MKYAVTVEPDEGGGYVASCAAMGASASGLSAASALDALRDEIRYRIELCPCTSVSDDFVQFDLGN